MLRLVTARFLIDVEESGDGYPPDWLAVRALATLMADGYLSYNDTAINGQRDVRVQLKHASAAASITLVDAVVDTLKPDDRLLSRQSI